MAIIHSHYGNLPTIRLDSFEHVVTNDGSELCEPCAVLAGFDVAGDRPDEFGHYDCTPIFASDEWDRESVCDHCGNVSNLHTVIGDTVIGDRWT